MDVRVDEGIGGRVDEGIGGRVDEGIGGRVDEGIGGRVGDGLQDAGVRSVTQGPSVRVVEWGLTRESESERGLAQDSVGERDSSQESDGEWDPTQESDGERSSAQETDDERGSSQESDGELELLQESDGELGSRYANKVFDEVSTAKVADNMPVKEAGLARVVKHGSWIEGYVRGYILSDYVGGMIVADGMDFFAKVLTGSNVDFARWIIALKNADDDFNLERLIFEDIFKHVLVPKLGNAEDILISIKKINRNLIWKGSMIKCPKVEESQALSMRNPSLNRLITRSISRSGRFLALTVLEDDP